MSIRWNLLRKARWHVFLSSEKWAVSSYLLCRCRQHGWRRGWRWGKSRDPPHRRHYGVPLRGGARWSRLLYPGFWQNPQRWSPSWPLSPLLGPSKQLTFFSKINHQERGKGSYKWTEQNTTLTWGSASWSEPQGPGWGSARQPLSAGSAPVPRFRRGWETCPGRGWHTKGVLAWTNPGRIQDEQKDLGRLFCVSDLGSPWEDGGCEVASPDGPCHSWHACHRYIGPKFKCLQKVKM